MIQDIKELIILTVIVLILLLLAMGFARSLERKAEASEQFFQQFDTNNDARVSSEEFPGPDDYFLNLDQDADGYIEKNELSETKVQRPPWDLFKHFDKDGDGTLSMDESPSRVSVR
jgi:Ca2+-binding EF-hand superfamily protein